jgi:transcriptional regulator with PAS, ATPase and Fis domain
MNPSTAKITAHEKPDAELIQEFCQNLQNCKTIDDAFITITSLFESLDVTIERITLLRDGETSEVTLNENASGIRREFKAQLQNTHLTIVCINNFTPNLNLILQSLVTSATATFQNLISKLPQPPNVPPSRMIGDSPRMRQLSIEIARAARSDHSVLIKGETGTGKTTAALMVHEQSPRSNKPFVDINCAALPEPLLESELFGYEKGAFTGAVGTKKGLFEIADGGTLFLDEIGEMKPELQAKLLTAIESKKIRRLGSTKDVPCDVRIITASSRNIQTMTHAGTFREDLYYRIAILEISIPPLREHDTDIPALVHHRLCIEQQLNARSTPYQIEPLALQALSLYAWPGNIRELQNIVSRLATRINSDEAITQENVLSQLPQPAIESGSLVLPAAARIINPSNDLNVLSQLPQPAIESGSVVLPAAARIINPGEDLYAFVARIQLLAINSTITATGNYPNAASRLGYGRTALISLRTKLQKGRYRRTKQKALTANPNQPLLPVD